MTISTVPAPPNVARVAAPLTSSPAAGAPSSRAKASYVSPFRRLLERGRWAALAIIVIWASSCFWALRVADVATRVIGHDTTPSITAAERIRGLLSDANRNLAIMTLIGEDDRGPFSSAFRGDISDAEALLVDAAQNITYGDAEKTPITAIMRGVAEYDRLVGRARTLAAGPEANQADAIRADALMRGTILPATEALDKANDDQLTASYGQFLQSKWQGIAFVTVSSLATLALLVALQSQMHRYSRRIFNIGLATSTIVVACVSVWTLGAFLSASADLRTAKSDAFDSIYALTTLLAVANDAESAQSFWLVTHDDPVERQRYDDDFQSATQRVVKGDVETALADAEANRPFQGLLGDELSNITFVGEDNAAMATLNAWADYMTIGKKLRGLEDDGKTAEAVALAGGVKPGQLNSAFEFFQRTLELTIRINQNAFDAAIAASEATINSLSYGILFASWLVASGLAWLGIRQRLREYEF